MEDEDYEPQRRKTDAFNSKPVPDDEEEEAYQPKKRHTELQSSPDNQLEPPLSNQPRTQEDISHLTKKPDQFKDGGKDVKGTVSDKPDKEAELQPLNPNPGSSDGAKEPVKHALPPAIKTRSTIINILCYLNTLFLLIYFPATV